MCDEDGDPASAENRSSAGAVWAYNCGASDGTESSAKFTFYPHAAGWSTMSPDDVETADNVVRFVESTLSGDEPSAGALHPLASFGRWLLRATRADEKGIGSDPGGDGVFFSAPSLARFEPSRAGSSPPHSRSCSSSSLVDDRRSSARS